MRNKMVLYTDIQYHVSFFHKVYNRKILSREKCLWCHTRVHCSEIISQPELRCMGKLQRQNQIIQLE